MSGQGDANTGAGVDVVMTGGGSGISNAGFQAESTRDWGSEGDAMDIDQKSDVDMGGV